MSAKIITIIGNVGSGKTSFIDYLEKQMEINKIDADSLFLSNPFLEKSLHDRNKNSSINNWSFICDLWFLKERVKLLGQIKFSNELPNFIDSGLPMSLAYCYAGFLKGQYSKDQWTMLLDIFEILTKDIKQTDVILHLLPTIEIAQQRIQKRARDYELEFYDKEFLQFLEESLEFVTKYYQNKGVEVRQIDSGKLDLKKDRFSQEELENITFF